MIAAFHKIKPAHLNTRAAENRKLPGNKVGKGAESRSRVMSVGCSDPITSAGNTRPSCGLEHTKVRGQRAQVRSKVSNILRNLQFSSVLAGGAKHASISISSVSPPPPSKQLPACSLASSEWRRSALMTRRHCFCNCAASDVDLSLALMAAPDGSSPCVGGGVELRTARVEEPIGAPNWSHWSDWYRVNGPAAPQHSTEP